MNSITVAVVQFDPRLGAKDENLHRMEALTSGTRADIIVFPELSTTGRSSPGSGESGRWPAALRAVLKLDRLRLQPWQGVRSRGCQPGAIRVN